MAKVLIGNNSAVTVPRQDRDSRKLYCDVLGGRIVKEDNERDNLRFWKKLLYRLSLWRRPR
jgi:hypothetical protein